MSSKNTTKKIAARPGPKHGEPRPSSRKHRDDDDIRSQSDAGYSSVTRISGYRHEGHKLSKGLQRLEDDDLPSVDPRLQRRAEPPRHNLDSLPPAERPPLVRSLTAVPYLAIYEHCVLLRKHGISVTLGPEVFRTITQQGGIEPRPMSYGYTCGAHNGPVDVHNPSAQEKQAVTEAIIFVLDCGGEVFMTGFDPQPVMRCSACSNPIPNPVSSPVSRPTSMRRDMDEHSNRNSFQNGQGCHPGTYENNPQGTIPIGLANGYDTGRSEGNWPGHGR
ncbi:uncharacterized protein A1O5_09021 [Cladophialophora psammophila CBS 110553]|uniref:Uncharacterized protein n=1 Tax=Cladophialophora psammophila CBS 110553 TaxID=1182543 RepID=W9WRP0_9EURO|nr:uncharacterized protein A1O5_09021 [Cladophialophora psammophila CBS 110553]EXJ67675.1 hypothetical protein A1O5_09021 [Cladophialophora psammophila CBS 110553]